MHFERRPADALHGLLETAGRTLGGVRMQADEPAPGITRLRLSSRATRINGMEAAVYLLGPIVVDTGFVHAAEPLLRFLDHRPVETIVLTHHHEDHAGAAGTLGARHGCPVHLRNPDRRFEEGLAELRPYRHLWWGKPPPYEPEDMPERLCAGGVELRAIPIPGHSATHTALFHEASGTVLTGDLFITGGATAVMSHENPFESVVSLRLVAALDARRALTGHALVLEEPASALRKKADAIEDAAARVLALRGSGAPVPEIVRRVFPEGRAQDLLLETITGGEFSRTCFVEACLRHAE